MVGPYLNQVGGNVDDDVNLFSGGLNTYVDKAFLESNQMPYTMNMRLGSAPGIRTRYPRKTIALRMENNTWETQVGSIIDIFTYDEYRFFVIARKDGKVYVYQIYRPEESGIIKNNYVVQNVCEIPEEPNYYFTIARRSDGPRVYITGLTFKLKLSVPLNPTPAVPVAVPDPEEPMDNNNGGYNPNPLGGE